MDLKNITYRIDHEGKVSLKPPFRVHSNKKAGIKPKLVPSIVFKEPSIWGQIEQTIKSELFKKAQDAPKDNKECLQLDFWKEDRSCANTKFTTNIQKFHETCEEISNYLSY